MEGLKQAFYATWTIVGVLLAFILGTLIAHVLACGWFTPVP